MYRLECVRFFLSFSSQCCSRLRTSTLENLERDEKKNFVDFFSPIRIACICIFRVLMCTVFVFVYVSNFFFLSPPNTFVLNATATATTATTTDTSNGKKIHTIKHSTSSVVLILDCICKHVYKSSWFFLCTDIQIYTHACLHTHTLTKIGNMQRSK